MKKELLKLIEYKKKASSRRRDGVFLVEGSKMFSECPKDRIVSVVATKSFFAENPDAYFTCERLNKAGVEFALVSDDEFSRLSDTKTPQGILAVVKAFSYTEKDLFSDPNGLFVFLESVQDPGNVGTVFRSGEAAGVSGVVLDANSADVYNPKVVRSTMGSVFRVPFVVTNDFAATLRQFQASGGRVFASALTGSVEYTKADFTAKSAILIGNESKGLTKETIENADERIRIPMSGQVESLNAAMAATVLLYEARRQRELD